MSPNVTPLSSKAPKHPATLFDAASTLIRMREVEGTRIGKSTATQKLTITAIKAEIGLIEHKLKKR
ncbi:MAG: hypothetical protein V4749_01530 [Pseudomonadota bacterium]